MVDFEKLAKYYLVFYLCVGGLVFTFIPQIGLSLMFAFKEYDSFFVRLMGVFLLGCGIYVVLMVLSKDKKFLKRSLVVNLVIILGMVYIFIVDPNKERLIFVLIGIVGFGVVLSILSLFKRDRKPILD